MNIVATKELADIRYMLGAAETAAGRYNQIKATFPKSDEYKIFAEPIILENGYKISWVTNFDGAVICYNKLSDEEKASARDLLSSKIKSLLDACKQFEDQSIVDFMYKCIEIPGMDDVFIVRKDGVDNVVLSQWGFVSDVPGAEKGLLNKILNTRKIPMNFNVVYSDNNEPAPYEDIIFEYDKKTESAKSDENGHIILPKVKEDCYVKAFEPDGEQRINMQGFTCYEGGRYTIKVTPKGDMLFVVTDQHQKPLSNLEFHIVCGDRDETYVTDFEGKMVFKRVKSGQTIRAFQLINGMQDNVNTFIADRKVDVYPIIVAVEEVVVKEPETHSMRFKVIDEKNNVIRDAEVTVKYDGKTQVLKTDADGYAVLPNIKPGTKVEVKAKK